MYSEYSVGQDPAVSDEKRGTLYQVLEVVRNDAAMRDNKIWQTKEGKSCRVFPIDPFEFVQLSQGVPSLSCLLYDVFVCVPWSQQ